jgi:protein TonB
MYADHKDQNALARSAPAIAVIALHAVVLYVLSVSMGMVDVPKFAAPVTAVFIPEAQEAQPEPEIPEVKPEIADVMPVEEPPPMIDFEEAIVPPAENPMPVASNSAISATEASGAPRELKTSNRVEPAYPPTSRRLGEQGTVKLRVLVDEKGRPTNVVVGQSSGFARLDQAAMEAVRKWRFVAATNGATAITTWTQVAITFRLTEAG